MTELEKLEAGLEYSFWDKEVNIVSWNGGVPKVDIRDWSETHERMTRGITLTEEHAAPVKDDYTR